MTILMLIAANIVFIVTFILFLPISLIIPKYRSLFWRRFLSIPTARSWRKNYSSAKVVSFHCASYGEYEHIRPFIKELKERNPEIKTVVLFFSPSGYEHINDTDNIDLKLYTPFENLFSQLWFFFKLKPQLHIFAKYDVWPNEIFALKMLKIPTVLINASLSRNSRRTARFRNFHKIIYNCFSAIYAVSREDAERYRKIFAPTCPIKVTGDTKNDQVLFRKEYASQNPLFPEVDPDNCLTLVAGSIWDEDWQEIKEGILRNLQQHEKFKVILCPHQPAENFISRLLKETEYYSPRLLSETDCDKINELPRVLIVNSIGKLAEIYRYASLAFVGGSFKAKIHNVLEPAIYGTPIITGPYIENSSEALQMQNNGLLSAKDGQEFNAILNKLLTEPKFLELTGKKAELYVINNLGVSRKLYLMLSEQGMLT